MQKWAEKFYKSKMWERCRVAALSRDRYLCQDCLKKGRITQAEEVHHIRPLTPDTVDNPEITLNLDNLVSLCHQCHTDRHAKREKRYTVDEFGRVTFR